MWGRAQKGTGHSLCRAAKEPRRVGKTGLSRGGLQEVGYAGLGVCAAVSRRAHQVGGREAWGRGQHAWFRGFSRQIKHQAGVYRVEPVYGYIFGLKGGSAEQVLL